MSQIKRYAVFIKCPRCAYELTEEFEDDIALGTKALSCPDCGHTWSIFYFMRWNDKGIGYFEAKNIALGASP